MGQDKISLRKKLRQKRLALSEGEQQQASASLLRQIQVNNLIRRPKRVACYLAADGEIDPWPIMEYCWSRGIEVYLPVISHLPWIPLWFSPFVPEMPMTPNRFGIFEPQVHPSERITAHILDIVFLPLVGFDAQGQRLGMGKGYYDRTLAFLQHRQHWRRPHCIGLAHHCQQTGNLPVNPHDFRLHGIATDREVILV